MNDEYFMKLAIEESRQGDAPYGAVLVKDGQIIAKGPNIGKRTNDSTAHAEINVIRMAQKQLKTTSLQGCTLYSSSESCPMCTGAEIWAGISRVVYGATIEQLIAAGQHQINTSSKALADTSFRQIEITGGVLADEALAVVQNWKRKD